MKNTNNSKMVSKRKIKRMKKTFKNSLSIFILILFFILVAIVAYGLFIIISQLISGEFLN